MSVGTSHEPSQGHAQGERMRCETQSENTGGDEAVRRQDQGSLCEGTGSSPDAGCRAVPPLEGAVGPADRDGGQS